MSDREHEPPSLDQLAAMAERALATIPPTLAAHMDNVSFVIQDWPEDETLQRLGIRNRQIGRASCRERVCLYV